MKAHFHYVRKFACMINRRPIPFPCLPTWSRIAAPAILFLLVNSQLAFSQVGDSILCGRQYKEDIPGVLMGGRISDTVKLTNGLLNKADSVFLVTLDDTSEFHLDVSSLHILIDSIGFLPLHYVPTDAFAHTASLTIARTDTPACATTISLSAPALQPTADNATFPLIPPTPNVVAIRTAANTTNLTVHFKNLSTSDFVVDSFYIAGIDSLTISSHPSYPDTLHHNDSLELSLTYKKTEPGFEQGYLIVMGGHTTIIEECVVEVQRLPNSSVPKSLSTTQTFWLYPNPSHGPITIHSDGVVNPHVKVTDVLGRTVREERFTQDWTWDGASAYGEHNEPGTYFIELSGITEQGKLVHEVRRVTIE